MNSVDLAFTSALEQAQLIGNKEISPLELTQLYLDRIEQLDSSLNSFFTVMAEQAIADAKAKTEQLSNGNELPPFFGVPIAIKDMCPVEGVPCTYGVHLLRNRIATEDGGLVKKIRQAGFIILGKTATSEIGSAPYTEPKGFPPTRNPWNLDYTPGGSSGGSAAAVAAGLCAVAQGSDGGGSIRIPAACCGLVGIKPSRGRVSSAPFGEKLSGLVADGTLARTVADAAALLDVMAGYILGDPYWLPAPSSSFLDATKQPVRSLKIGFATTIKPIGAADPIGERAVRETVQLLEDLGHPIEPIELDFSDLLEPLITVWQASVDVGIPGIFLGKLNRWLLRRSRYLSAWAPRKCNSPIIKLTLLAIAYLMETLTLKVPPAVGLTDEQFYQLCVANEEWRLELTAQGELIIMPPTGGESGIRNADLTTDLSLWNRQTRLGKVFDSSTEFRLPNGAKRSPDVSWVKLERWEALSPEDRKRFPPLCPDFVIELRSETDSLKQLRAKMQEYQANGARLGWLIDPQTPLVEIYRPTTDVETINFSFEEPPTLSGEDVLPGFVLDLTPILNA